MNNTSITQILRPINKFYNGKTIKPIPKKKASPHPTPYPVAELGNICEIGQPPSEKVKLNQVEKFILQSAAREILPAERVKDCFRVPLGSLVDVMRNVEHMKGHYKGLATCGSVWVCPVCSSKISERRREELVSALGVATSLGLVPYLVTLTPRHNYSQTLKEVSSMFDKARGLMRNRKPYKKWALKIGLVGSIRGLETTHGGNGWHYHTHEIFFCRPGAVPIQSDLLPMWQAACISAGLGCPDGHGVDIKTGNEAIGNYVCKWGIESEVTKGMMKKGRNGNRTPWDILRDYSVTESESDAKLFRDYAARFKGKRQLVWSEGLRKLLCLKAEKSDEEIAAEIEEGSILLGSLTLQQWRLVLRHNKRGEVLLIAARGDINDINLFISRLEETGN